MHQYDLLQHLAIALGAAFLGGLAASLFRLPLILGYLGAGIAVGPNTPGFIADQETVHSVAHVGVALLMFAVGVHFSLRELAAVRRVALLGGGLQIGGTILLGLGVGLALGWDPYTGLFLGCALALSSTAVMLRVLEERGELGSAHGGAMIGILIVQDLSLVLMVAVLPSLALVGERGVAALGPVAASLGIALVSIAGVLVLASRAVPALLRLVARLGSRELFLLTAVCVCLGAGYLAVVAGLSLEIGAFLAGLVISESDYAHEVFSQVRPLRDVFASLFFVSIGMLFDPRFLAENWLQVLAVVLAIVVGKAVIGALAVGLAGEHGRTAVIAGLGLAQIGEFSFVLASIGTARQLVSDEVPDVILASALLTLLLAPFLYAGGAPVYAALNRLPGLSALLNRRGGDRRARPQPPEEEAPQVILVGCGRVGGYISDALTELGIRHVGVDFDAAAIGRLRDRGVPVVYGDATSEVVLEKAHPERATLAVVALPDAEMSRMAVQALRHLAPDLHAVVRVHRAADIGPTRQAGAYAVVHTELEAGTEIVRQSLWLLGLPERQVHDCVERLRATRYAEAAGEEVTGPPPG